MPNIGDYVKATDFDELKPKLSIGTVTTGAAGTNASASITGTTPNFTLNLTIPKGDVGATGPAGPSGTFTGPLKPTSSYFRPCDVVWGSGYAAYVRVPSGGTWAIFATSDLAIARMSNYLGTISYSGNGYVINIARAATIKSGGAQLTTYLNNGEFVDVGIATLCWRIQ